MAGEIDFRLLSPTGPADIAMSYGRGQQEAQANQLAQMNMRQQNVATQSAEMNLARLKQEHEALDKLMADITANGGPDDPMKAADMMINSKHPEWFAKGLAMKQSYAQLNNDRIAMGLPPLPNAAAPAPAAAAPTNAMAPMTAPAPTSSVNALAAPPAAEPDKNTLIMQAKSMLLSSNPGVRVAGEQQLKALTAPPTLHTVAPGASLVGPDGKPLFTAAERADTDLIRNFNAAKAQGFTGNLFDYERKLNEARRTPAAAPTPAAPVAVVGPDGKQIYVSREEALRNRMTPAAAMESLPPKEIQKREAALPQATSAIKGFEQNSDSFIKDLESLRDHPGLNQITGIAAGRLPGVTSDARAAEAKYEKIVAKGGFQMLQNMRDASKTGGALGNVSNQEGKQLTSAFAAIQRTQDAKDVRAAIDQAISDIQGAKVRMREAYDSTYAYKSNAPVAATGKWEVVK